MQPEVRKVYEAARGVVQKQHSYTYNGWGTGWLEANCECGANWGHGEALLVTDLVRKHVEELAQAAGVEAILKYEKENAA